MRKAKATRDRVLDAALKVFAERGFRGATTREIAAAAKVNEVTLFRHFKSKGALFSAALSERSPLIEVQHEVSLDLSEDIDEVLAGNMRTVLRILRANKHLFMVIFGDAWRQPKVRSLAAAVVTRRGIEFIASFLKRQMDDGRLRKMDPEVAARALMGMVQAYFLTNDILEDRRVDQAEDDRMVRGFVKIYLDGMRLESGGRER